MKNFVFRDFKELTSVKTTDALVLADDAGWLTRWLWAFLKSPIKLFGWKIKKVGLHFHLEDVKHHVLTETEQKDLLESLSDHFCRLVDAGENPENFFVAIGADEFNEMTGVVRMRALLFDFTTHLTIGVRGTLYTYEKIQCGVLPLMSGIAVIPKDALWEQR